MVLQQLQDFFLVFLVEQRKIVNYFLKISGSVFGVHFFCYLIRFFRHEQLFFDAEGFCACGLFQSHFHVLPMHSGSTKVKVNSKLVQEFSADYHVVLTERVSHICAQWLIVTVGSNSAILKRTLHLPPEEKFPATQLKLIFLHVFFSGVILSL